MANSIRDYFENAQLSMAAYATLQLGMAGSVYEDALKDQGMTPSQATQFATDYSIVAPTYTDATGLAVNLFRRNDTGEIVIAIRGTGPGWGFVRDLIEDIELGRSGIARNQLVSLYNYVQRLITPAGQETATQVMDVAPEIDPLTGQLLNPDEVGIQLTDPTFGAGYLSGAAGITVTGHSLGGHLAAAACIEDPVVVQKILDHLAAKASAADTKRPESRAPPQAVLFS